MGALLDIIIFVTNNFSSYKIVKYMNEFYDLEIQISKITADDYCWITENGKIDAKDKGSGFKMNIINYIKMW